MKIVHVIDSLEIGGTEDQFLSLLPDLSTEHEIVLATLSDAERAGLGDLPVARRYSLGFSGYRSLPRAVLKLRNIIAAEKPDLVRAQLYWSSIVARLATPPRVPLVFSIHSTMSIDGYTKNRAALWLERLTYGRRHALIGVSQHVLDDFDQHVGIKGRASALMNFIRAEFLEHRRNRRAFGPPFRLVAAGNLKEAKNYPLLLSAMKLLPGDVTLDIYGEGHLRPQLEHAIRSDKLKVRLAGVRSDMWNVLPEYDLFVMPSLHEGCPNAALQAMAVGLPLLLSDIPAMHEVSRGNALFFDPHDPGSLVRLLERVRAGHYDLQGMSDRGVAITRANHLKTDYLKRLNEIYAEEVLSAGRSS